MKQQAWIQDPKTANTMRFHQDPKSWSAHSMYFVDSGRPLTGAPPLLKHRRELMREEAIKLWCQKRQEGWRACPPQWIPQKPLRD
jgi:hypothetical protein